MEQIGNEIRLYSTIKEINTLLKNVDGKERGYTRHYNQNEEFFIKLSKSFTIPQFPIHHEVTNPKPKAEYVSALTTFLGQVVPLIPSVFTRMTYFFDPAEIFHPSFYQILKYKEQIYLNLLRLDLTYRPNDSKLLKRGTNDRTNLFSTRNLFMEFDLLPLQKIIGEKGIAKSFIVKQNISRTWLGETGKGYHIEGIWMDTELTKFLSKLFIPEGKTTYPYYPFTCKYQTMCHTLFNFSPEGRKKHLIYLHKAEEIVLPEIDKIQNALKNTAFSQDLPEFRQLKTKVPLYWKNVWKQITVNRYLNDNDMKEFSIEF